MKSNIITVIPVYNGERFILQTLQSMAIQTIRPDRLVVLDNCSTDDTEKIVKSFTGMPCEWIRNPKNLGLFGNFNRALEIATGIDYLHILCADDLVEPTFVEAMTELTRKAPGRGFYCGVCNVMNENGELVTRQFDSPHAGWHEMDVVSTALHNPVCFAGQIIRVDAAKKVGGFRTTSHFCGDWELWVKLGLRFGAAMTERVVATLRDHDSPERGTSAVIRSGKVYALTNAQRKENLALLGEHGIAAAFDRAAIQKSSPLPLRFLLAHGRDFSPRLLRYNVSLLLLSEPPHPIYRFVQSLIRLFGPNFVRLLSRIWNAFHS